MPGVVKEANRGSHSYPFPTHTIIKSSLGHGIPRRGERTILVQRTPGFLSNYSSRRVIGKSLADVYPSGDHKPTTLTSAPCYRPLPHAPSRRFCGQYLFIVASENTHSASQSLEVVVVVVVVTLMKAAAWDAVCGAGNPGSLVQ